MEQPHEVIPMIQDRLIDFIRIHMSQIGGITPAKKILQWVNSTVSELHGMDRVTRRQ
ncbi:MAG: hypothetical protein Ct9H300mP19_00210 [Dehalococcoidia bacterium]|nr:MAG: hypothetical protein Ct9H300mP19_00210 [Dehalococcoidia bacterium]